VKSGTDYTVAWRANVARPGGKASSPGDVMAYSICGGYGTVAAVADVRSANFAQETISGHVNAGCRLRVQFYQADRTLPSSVEFAEVSVTVADPIGAASTPRYPALVLDNPAVSLKVTYTGHGWLQAWYKGRWSTLGFMPGSTGAPGRSTVTIAVPAHLQGRLINLNYDNAHVIEFNALYHMTGDTFFRDRALAWLRYTPAMEGLRVALNESVPANPSYADIAVALQGLQSAQLLAGP